ncbi:MAG: hypothetical protein QXL68_05565 [Desulfurococcaceae archaeon]
MCRKNLITLLLLLLAVSAIETVTNSYSYSSTKDYTRSELASLINNRLRELGFFVPEKIDEYLNVLPGYPTASFKIVNELYLNETGSKIPVRIFSQIIVHGKVIVDYTTHPLKRESIEQFITNAIGIKYEEAVELFYNYVQGLKYGIPSGYYDSYRIIGIKELNIPSPMELKHRIKPKLLAIFIGLSDGDWIKGPLYIYYFAFETTGTTFEGSYTRVIIVLSIIIDINHVLYVDTPTNCGVVYSSSIATYSPVTTGFPVATLYGVIGVLLALAMVFIEYDEEYKYYITIFFLFIIQIFSFLALCAVMGVSIDKVFTIILSLGPWFTILTLLWIPPYVFSTYKFFLTSESQSTPSYFSSIFEGIVLSIISVILVLMIVLIRPFTEYLIVTSGPSAVYIIIVILTAIDVYLGYSIGKLWATFGKYTSSY